ncbi:MAG: phosphatidylserine decarboxylase [Phycisphaerae bacterium]|nr:phosphatidylserine decarboxylase [Phycisphaerae bacterium]
MAAVVRAGAPVNLRRARRVLSFNGCGQGVGRVRVAPEGIPIIASFVLVSAALSTGAVWWLGGWGWLIVAPLALVTLWSVWFFRDPDRQTPDEPGAVICPADGVICFIGPAEPPPGLGLPREHTTGLTRLSVFMNVFNVHVNRSPAGGRVENLVYAPGTFLNASLDKASEHNERMTMVLRPDDGPPLIVVQIAGLVARRIVCRVSEGTRLRPGERYGLIRFGSRVDVYLPPGRAASVRVGDRVVAGETIVARAAGVGSAGPTGSAREAAHAGA